MSFDCSLPKRRMLIPVALGAVFALALAATASPTGAQTSSTPPQFASGAVTSIHGTSVQVSNQAQSSESTVVLSPTTQITKRETAAASAITVGTCVRVTGTGSTSKGITAQSVALSTASASGCNGGPGGGAGAGGAAGGPGGFRFGNGQRPRNFGGTGTRPPGGFGSGSGTRPANFALASGPVVSISGDKMVVKSTTFQRPTATSTKAKNAKAKSTKPKSTAKPKTSTTNVTVSLTGTTTITQTVTGSASDVAVGSCVTATGTTAAGSVAADRVMVSQPVNGSCSIGFGFGGRGGGAPGGAV
jgi:hypothetical protein